MNIINVHILTWIGVTFIAVGTILTFVGQQIISNKSTDKISELNEKIVKQAEEISSKSDKITELSTDTLKSITGGDSYAYLTRGVIRSEDGINTQARLRIQTVGKYLMYDVRINIFDPDNESNLVGQKLGPTVHTLGWPTYVLGTLRPSSGEEIAVVNLGNKDEKFLSVIINARNGMFSQMIKFKRTPSGEWKQAIQVTKIGGENPIILEKVDEGYPVGKNGIWGASE